MTARSPFVGTCADDKCRHAWAVCYLPMEMEKAAKMMRDARCPMCGNSRVLVGGTLP